MHNKFLKLDEVKKNQILNAALDEFTIKGYKNASTNEIIKKASISKGLLFHYFKNKKLLFIYLYEYCINLYIKEFYEKINSSETDFFLIMKDIFRIKLELYKKYPYTFKFVEIAYFENSPEIKNEITHINEIFLENNISKIYGNVDMSKFKEGLEFDKVINIIHSTLDSITNIEFNKYKIDKSYKINYYQLFEEAEKYLKIFQDCFYA